MELLWNDLSVLRLIHRSTEQVEVAGNIPPPGGCRAAELLDCSAEVEISNCKTETGKLNFEGRLCITIAAADETGDTFAFVGEIPFSHCTENADFAAGMLSNALPAVAVLDMRLAADGAAAFSANVNIDFIVTSAAPVRVLSGVSGVADMEIKSMQCRTARRVEIGSETIRFSEELSSEGADSVLSFSAQISVRDTAIENGGTSVSGIITLNALLKTSDGELMQLTRGVPFRESLSAAVGADEIYTVAELKNVSLRALGTEFSLLAFDADIDFRIFGIRRSVIDIPTDAYSPSLNFSCMYEKMTVANACGGSFAQHSLRENLSVPDGMADIFAALNAAARPIATNVSIEDSTMTVEGLLFTRIIYRSSSNRIYSFNDDVPFVLRMAAPSEANFAQLRLNASASISGGSGRTAQVSYNLDVSAEYFSESAVSAVAGVAETDNSNDADGKSTGIILCNACAGEDAFDIGKRFGVPSQRVRELNPDSAEPFKDGDKLLLFV